MTPARRYGLPSVEEAAALLRERDYFVGPLGTVTDEAGAAALLACSRRTLRNWRDEGFGPTHWMTSGWVYPIQGLLDFIADETEKHVEGKSGQFAIAGSPEDGDTRDK